MTAVTASQDEVAFALRTSDEQWINRNGGTIDADGRVIVMVPAAEVTMKTLQMPHRTLDKLTRFFEDCPGDFPNAWIASFGDWVPETAERLRGDR
jgi:hypothetical protein